MRLIDADELKKALRNPDDKRYLSESIISLVFERIDNAPTVPNEYMRGYEAAEREYKRPQGEWQLYGMIYYCSNCGKDCEQGGNNYCGQCGADMRGDEE